MSTSAGKCSHCGFEFPQARTRDDEMEDRLINEGNKAASEATEETMDDAMKRPLRVPRRGNDEPEESRSDWLRG
jgi:hypothetical protein